MSEPTTGQTTVQRIAVVELVLRWALAVPVVAMAISPWLLWEANVFGWGLLPS